MTRGQKIAQRIRLAIIAVCALTILSGVGISALASAVAPSSQSTTQDDNYMRFSTGGTKGPDIRMLITKDCEIADPHHAPKFIPASVITDDGKRMTFDAFYKMAEKGNAPYALMFCKTTARTR